MVLYANALPGKNGRHQRANKIVIIGSGTKVKITHTTGIYQPMINGYLCNINQ